MEYLLKTIQFQLGSVNLVQKIESLNSYKRSKKIALSNIKVQKRKNRFTA